MTAGALVRHRACIVPLGLVSCYWCSVIATPVTKARYRFPCPFANIPSQIASASHPTEYIIDIKYYAT